MRDMTKLEKMFDAKLKEMARQGGSSMTWLNQGLPDKWEELLALYGAVEIDTIISGVCADTDVDRSKYCYFDSPCWDGNVVRIPQEEAEKILVLGFI